MARRGSDPVRITSATRSKSEDIRAREKRYIVSMSIRTVCFVLTVVSIGHWFMWVFLVGALVLPYVAVVMANAAGGPDPGGPATFGPPSDLPQIQGPPSSS